MAQDVVVLDGDLSINIPLDGDAQLDLQVDGTPDKVIKITEYDLPVYDGATEITPSNQAQVLQTSNKAVTRNIVVNPIPSNYGLITWNGSTLTVS